MYGINMFVEKKLFLASPQIGFQLTNSYLSSDNLLIFRFALYVGPSGLCAKCLLSMARKVSTIVDGG